MQCRCQYGVPHAPGARCVTRTARMEGLGSNFSHARLERPLPAEITNPAACVGKTGHGRTRRWTTSAATRDPCGDTQAACAVATPENYFCLTIVVHGTREIRQYDQKKTPNDVLKPLMKRFPSRRTEAPALSFDLYRERRGISVHRSGLPTHPIVPLASQTDISCLSRQSAG